MSGLNPDKYINENSLRINAQGKDATLSAKNG